MRLRMATFQILPLTLPKLGKLDDHEASQQQPQVNDLILHNKRIIAGYSSGTIDMNSEEGKKTVRIWNPDAALCVKTFLGAYNSTKCLAIAAYGDYIVSGYNNNGGSSGNCVSYSACGSIQLNKFPSGDDTSCMVDHGTFRNDGMVKSLAMNKNYVASASWDGGVKIWKWSGNGEEKCLTMEPFIHDPKSMFTGDGVRDKKNFALYPNKKFTDSSDLRTPVTLKFYSNYLFRACKLKIEFISIDDETGFFQDWLIGDGDGEKKVHEFKGNLIDMDVDEKEGYVVVVYNELTTGVVEVIDLDGIHQFKIQMEEGDLFNCCAIYSKTIAVAGSSNKVRIIDIDTKKIIQKLHVPDGDAITDIDIDDKRVVCGGKSGKIYMYSRKEFGSCGRTYETVKAGLKI